VADPPPAAGVVAALCVEQPGDHRHEAVHVVRVVHTGCAHHRDAAGKHLLGVGVGLRRRLKAGDRALEQQRAARRIRERELDECSEVGLQRRPWIIWQPQGPQVTKQRQVAVGEHRIEQSVLRLKVGVQGGLADAQLAGERMQCDARDALRPGQLPRRGEDLRDPSLTPRRNHAYHG
jgi:hypothetical protein